MYRYQVNFEKVFTTGSLVGHMLAALQDIMQSARAAIAKARGEG